MAVAAKHKVGRLYPTQAEGVYRRLRADGKYTFYARRADGKRNFEACDSFEAAKARRADFTGKNIKGEVIGSPATTLAQVIEQWRATRTHVKPRTRVTEETHIRLHFDPHFGAASATSTGRRWSGGSPGSPGRTASPAR